MTLAAPRSFGKYLLEREIARGGMARVHLATLRGLGGFEKRLVVKEILPELASDPRFVAMFVEEAKVLVALSHPNIVPVYELGIVDGTYFLAMEHVEGATLADLVAERALTPAETSRVGAEIADALAYAHERFGLVHRDVSPRNVMVDTTGHARLLDFGIAARAEVGDGDALYGTPGFLSPEQARGEKLAVSSDLFSLGCVLAFALRGASPFPAKELDRLRELARAPDVAVDDEAFRSLIHELLAPTPAGRPASARSVSRALAAIASRLEKNDENAMTTLAARAGTVQPIPFEVEPRAVSTEGELTPRKVETLAKSQALEAMMGTSPIAAGTARIERVRAAPSVPSPRGSMLVAIGLSVVVSSVAALLVSSARFELTPTPVIDAADHGLVSPADIEPLAIEPGDADTGDAATTREADATVAPQPELDAAVPHARDAAPRGNATLAVRATPWANVTIDGHGIGTTPIRRTVISAGAHVIALDCPPLGRHVERSIQVEPGARLEMTADLERDPPLLRGP